MGVVIDLCAIRAARGERKRRIDLAILEAPSALLVDVFDHLTDDELSAFFCARARHALKGSSLDTKEPPEAV